MTSTAESCSSSSNAFTSLQKHTSVDRSIHHDRIRQREGLGAEPKLTPTKNFRSSPSPIAAAHEADFRNFVNHNANHALPGHHARALQPPALGGHGGWVSDFEAMNLQPALSQGPLAAQGSALRSPNWHHEFVGNSQGPGMALQPQATARPYGLQYPSGYMPMHNMMPTQHQQSPDVWKQEEGGMVDRSQQDAFEAAFSSVAMETEVEASKVASAAQEARELREAAEEARLASAAITSEAKQVIEEEQAEEKPVSHDNRHRDDLAKTAAELLESVGENRSQKFQQSSFLALMRKLRDREVTIEGDKVVAV